MKLSRRKFIGNSVLASASMMIPRFIQGSALKNNFGLESNKKLVIIQLSGGNDGLNMIVPFRNDTYYKYRPIIGINQSKVLKITDDIGFNPYMLPLQKLYDEGLMCILNGVGYPNPDYSHFRSMEIWHTGRRERGHDLYESGWVGRYLDSECIHKCATHLTLQLDEVSNLAMRGKTATGLAINDINALSASINQLKNKDIICSVSTSGADTYNDYIYKSVRETNTSLEYLQHHYKQGKSAVEYPNSGLGKRLKNIASFIIGESETRIYYVSMGGFDTHSTQLAKHNRLLDILSNALFSFITDLKKNGLSEEVCVMVFSEFGRRVNQNASDGTDHGSANNVLILGKNLIKKGVFNKMPNLDDLNDNNLKYEIDFRSIYSTLLNKWMHVDDGLIMEGNYPLLPFL